MTDHNPTKEDQNKSIVHEQSLDSGRETIHLRTLFDATAIEQNLRPIRNSTPYPVDKTLILLLVNLVAMAISAYLAAVKVLTLVSQMTLAAATPI